MPTKNNEKNNENKSMGSILPQAQQYELSNDGEASRDEAKKFPSKTRGVPSLRGGVCDELSLSIVGISHTPSARETLASTPLVQEGNLTHAPFPTSSYTPHPKQLDFHRDPSRNRWIFGGNRTGKTECGAQEAIMWLTGEHNYRTLNRTTETIGWVVSLSMQVQRDVTQAKILSALEKKLGLDCIEEMVMHKGRKDSPKGGVIDFIKLKPEFGGGIIGFKSCEQGREKFQGTSLDWVWFDEEPPEDVYQECVLRTMDREGSIWGTMTPLKGRTWVYETIFLRGGQDEISTHQMSWEDNIYLPPAEIKKMTRRLSFDQLESRKYGRFMEGTGLVFNEFSDENLIDFIDPALKTNMEVTISIDPGHNHPTAVLWIARSAGGDIYVFKDYSETHQTPEKVARYIKKQCEILGVNLSDTEVLIDTAALQRVFGMQETVATQFRKLGLNLNPRVNKSVAEGIMRMKALFKNADGERQLFITRTCVDLIRELRSYYWGEDEKPTKKNDHCIDALRYYVATHLDSSFRLRERKSERQKFKRQLMQANIAR